MTRALVLSGGGFAGAAWMVGLIEGLRERNIDLGAADLIVGTSGGARTGAQLASRTLGQAAGIYRRGEAPPATAPVPLDSFVTASMGILADAQGQEAARRIANLEPLGERLGDPAERRAVIAAHLPVQEWPDQRLAIVAVDAETGARVAFEASSGVPLLDAEVAELGEATVNVIIADEASLAAIGPDPLAVETMPAAVDAGAAQAQREAIVWDRER
jgi:NTE family protein